MSEKVLYDGEKNIKSITLEFSCKCGGEFEVTIKSKEKDIEFVKSEGEAK